MNITETIQEEETRQAQEQKMLKEQREARANEKGWDMVTGGLIATPLSLVAALRKARTVFEHVDGDPIRLNEFVRDLLARFDITLEQLTSIIDRLPEDIQVLWLPTLILLGGTIVGTKLIGETINKFRYCMHHGRAKEAAEDLGVMPEYATMTFKHHSKRATAKQALINTVTEMEEMN